MRQFIVLGFATTSAADTGEQIHLGCDRGKALEVLTTAEKQFVRKELYELAVPHVSRRFDRTAEKTTSKKTPAKK